MPQAGNIGDRPLPMPSPPRKVDQRQGTEQRAIVSPIQGTIRITPRARYLHDQPLATFAFKRAPALPRAQNSPHRPSRPHDHRHVSRQPRPRLLALAKRVSRPSRPHIDPSHSPPSLCRSPAPEARFLLPGQARRPITTRLLLPSRPPR
jgi:hypothetical protein